MGANLRLIRGEKKDPCQKCKTGCSLNNRDLFEFCRCDCHLTIVQAGGTLQQDDLIRGFMLMSGQPLVRLVYGSSEPVDS